MWYKSFKSDIPSDIQNGVGMRKLVLEWYQNLDIYAMIYFIN